MRWIIQGAIEICLELLQEVFQVIAVSFLGKLQLDIGANLHMPGAPSNFLDFVGKVDTLSERSVFDDTIGVLLQNFMFWFIIIGIIFAILYAGIDMMKALAGSDSVENPVKILGRALLACVFVLFSYHIFVLIEHLFNLIYYEVLNLALSSRILDGISGSIDSPLGEHGFIEALLVSKDFAGLGNFSALFHGLVNLIILGVVMVNFFKLYLEIVERYVLLGVMYYTSPIFFGFISTRDSYGVFNAWTKMVFSHIIVMFSNAVFLSVFIGMMGRYGALERATMSFTSHLLSMFILISWLIIGQHFDEYLRGLGMSTATTGGRLAGALVGSLAAIRTMQVLGSAGKSIAHSKPVEAFKNSVIGKALGGSNVLGHPAVTSAQSSQALRDLGIRGAQATKLEGMVKSGALTATATTGKDGKYTGITFKDTNNPSNVLRYGTSASEATKGKASNLPGTSTPMVFTGNKDSDLGDVWKSSLKPQSAMYAGAKIEGIGSDKSQIVGGSIDRMENGIGKGKAVIEGSDGIQREVSGSWIVAEPKDTGSDFNHTKHDSYKPDEVGTVQERGIPNTPEGKALQDMGYSEPLQEARVGEDGANLLFVPDALGMPAEQFVNEDYAKGEAQWARKEAESNLDNYYDPNAKDHWHTAADIFAPREQSVSDGGTSGGFSGASTGSDSGYDGAPIGDGDGGGTPFEPSVTPTENSFKSGGDPIGSGADYTPPEAPEVSAQGGAYDNVTPFEPREAAPISGEVSTYTTPPQHIASETSSTPESVVSERVASGEVNSVSVSEIQTDSHTVGATPQHAKNNVVTEQDVQDAFDTRQDGWTAHKEELDVMEKVNRKDLPEEQRENSSGRKKGKKRNRR